MNESRRHIEQAAFKETTESLGVSNNQPFSAFLKRLNALVSSAKAKGLENHGRQLKWIVAKFFPWWRKNARENILKEVGVSLSKPTIKRRLHVQEYRGFTSRCKPQVTLGKNSKAGLLLTCTRIHLQQPAQLASQPTTASPVLERESLNRCKPDLHAPVWWEGKSMGQKRKGLC